QALERAERSGRPERRLVPGLGLAVPGTHLLAHVAAEHPFADLLGKLAGDVAAVLDGQVRDASPPVQHVGRDERPGGACVEAGRAGPAALGPALRAGRGGGLRDDPEEEVGPGRRGEEVLFLAEPAEAGARGETALEAGARAEGPAAGGARRGADELA